MKEISLKLHASLWCNNVKFEEREMAVRITNDGRQYGNTAPTMAIGKSKRHAIAWQMHAMHIFAFDFVWLGNIAAPKQVRSHNAARVWNAPRVICIGKRERKGPKALGYVWKSNKGEHSVRGSVHTQYTLESIFCSTCAHTHMGAHKHTHTPVLTSPLFPARTRSPKHFTPSLSVYTAEVLHSECTSVFKKGNVFLKNQSVH